MSKKLCKDTEIKAFSHWHFEFSMARFWAVPVFCNKVWTVWSAYTTADFPAQIHSAGCSRRENPETLGHDKCPGFFYVHYTTHGTYSFTSHPKDEAITVKCLAQGHKRRDRPGRASNPHSDNTRTWVQCARPLGHDTPLQFPQWFSLHHFKDTNKHLTSSH